ncbi:MAG: hypothetical protein ACE37H_18560 [Phycisphaeraceae bacterium]
MNPHALNRTLIAAAVSLACFLPSISHAQDQPAGPLEPTDQQAPAEDAEAERLRAILAEEQRKLLAFQKKMESARAALAAITLPDNATREQCIAYLDALTPVAKALGLWEFNDAKSKLFIPKLVGVFPAEHVDLLLSEVIKNTSLVLPARLAVRDMQLDPQIVKHRVLARLEESPELIQMVMRNGWCEDARPLIIQAVLAEEELPTRDWFVAAVELKEPKLYQRLHERAADSPDAVECINVLTVLPDYDLAHTISVVMKRVEAGKLKFKSAYIEKDLHLLAAERGDVAALGHVINDIDGVGHLTPRNDPYEIGGYGNAFENPRLKVIRLIDFKGTDRQIRDWYQANRDKLVFDAFTRRFVVPEDAD